MKSDVIIHQLNGTLPCSPGGLLSCGCGITVVRLGVLVENYGRVRLYSLGGVGWKRAIIGPNLHSTNHVCTNVQVNT